MSRSGMFAMRCIRQAVRARSCSTAAMVARNVSSALDSCSWMAPSELRLYSG
jgi:hypothetical protein